MKSSKKIPHPVIPAQAGIQLFKHVMDSRLRTLRGIHDGNDKNEPKFTF
jgi:hypothetical protein